MRTYEIVTVDENPPLAGDIDGTRWEQATVAPIDQFSWYESGPKPTTEARAMASDSALTVQFQVEDTEISAQPRELNGPVYEDSSVEFFARPRAERTGRYFNFEVNCVGDMHMGWREPGWTDGNGESTLITPDLAEEIEIRSSVEGAQKDPKPDDESWWLTVRFPRETLRAFTGEAISFESGTKWSGNFYRHGVPDSQRATWNRIETEAIEYHSPEYFGRLRFV